MCISFLVFIFYAFGNCVGDAESDWSINVRNYFIGMKPYQLVIYKNQARNESISEIDSALGKLPQSIPTLIINLTANNISKIPKRQNGLIIYVQDKSDANDTQIKNFINFYEKQYPTQPRQKCLIFSLNKQASYENDKKNILNYAWQKKFLDFTILKICIDSNETYFYTLNPFYEKIKKVKFSNNTQLFPNKLHNFNKYPFILPVYSNEPYVSVVKDLDEKIRLKNFEYDSFLMTSITQMNFFVKFFEIDYVNKSTIKIIIDIFGKLKNNILNMDISIIPAALIPRSFPYLILHTEPKCYVAVMKYHSSAFQLNFSLSTLICFGGIIAFIFFIKWIVRLFKLTAFSFDLMDIVRITVGMSLISLPKILSKRILILTAMFGSMFLSAELVTLLTMVFSVNEEVSFNSIEEVYQSEYKLIIASLSYQTIFMSMDETSKKLFSRYVTVDDSIKCPYILLNNEKSVCIISDIRLQEALKNSKKLTKILKVLPFKFLCLPNKAYPFEVASPYINHFDLIFKQMYESGIFNKLNKEINIQNGLKIFKFTSDDESESLLIISLMLMLTLGIVSSLMAFVNELIVFHHYT